MTSHEITRCAHCHTKYVYQASGWGEGPYNSGKYCPECQKAIQEALALIPAKFTREWVETTDYDVETLVRWRDERRAARDPEKLYCERVAMPLFDMDDPANIHHTGYATGQAEHAGCGYRWEYWSKEGISKGKVWKAVWKNCQTGMIVEPCARGEW